MQKFDLGKASAGEELGGLEDELGGFDDELGGRDEEEVQPPEQMIAKSFSKISNTQVKDIILGGLEDEETPAEAPKVTYFNDKIKEGLQMYRQQKEQLMQNNQVRTAEGNLKELFKQFDIQAQQRNKIFGAADEKINLQKLKQFEEKPLTEGPAHNLVTSLFSEVNPFS